MDDLNEWLVEKNTWSDIVCFLVYAMDQWRRWVQVTLLRDYDFDGMNNIFEVQAEIG